MFKRHALARRTLFIHPGKRNHQMKRRRWTTLIAVLLVPGPLNVSFAAVPIQEGHWPEVHTQSAGTPMSEGVTAVPSASLTTSEGKPIATELPPEVKRLIDGIRHLHEQPGLILDREAVYQSLGVKPTSLHVPKTTGGRYMSEELAFVRTDDDANWRGTLEYFEYPDSQSWTVKVGLSYGRGPNCYPTRLVESYWGKPFVFRPLGSHGLLADLLRQHAGSSPTGPHDGVPYNAEFGAVHLNSANVVFYVGRGGCVFKVGTSRLFKMKEFSDDHVYHE